MLNETQIKKTQLDNGIRILSERMPFVRSASFGVFIKAGSSSETSSELGIAHFLEHVLFKGSTNRSAQEIATSLESRGGEINGSTGKEYSVYSAYCLGDDLPLAVDVLLDLIQHPKFDSRGIELERQVVLSEITHAGEDPEETILDQFYQNVFPNHPLGTFIYGSKENVKHFTRDDIESFWKRFYQPPRIVISAAGDVDHDQLVDAVVKHWDDAVQPVDAPDSGDPEMHRPEPLMTMSMRGVHQAHVVMGGRTIGFHNPRKYTLILLDLLLGGGMSSRLFQNIRERYGFTYSVYSFADILEQHGVMGMYLSCHRSKVDESLKLLQKELFELQQGVITEKEVEQLKQQIRGNLILGMEYNARRMRKNGETELFNGNHQTLTDIMNAIERVSRDDMIALANEMFVSSNMNTTILSP